MSIYVYIICIYIYIHVHPQLSAILQSGISREPEWKSHVSHSHLALSIKVPQHLGRICMFFYVQRNPNHVNCSPYCLMVCPRYSPCVFLVETPNCWSCYFQTNQSFPINPPHSRHGISIDSIVDFDHLVIQNSHVKKKMR